jgi:tetratricopeptide (TPR) repeat protein
MRSFAVSLAVLSLCGAAAEAQPILKLPDASPRARVEQTVGLTDLSVTYARPAVKGRKVWGDLVPFGQVWRAGANENTVVSFSTPVTVEGKPLAAGKYGLHLLPSETGAWTAIFSNNSGNWGSYSYDAKEDALRVPVTPEAAPLQERLQYTIDDVTDGGAVLALRWEKLRIPIHLGVDTNAVTVASLRQQLFGLPQFFPQGWNDAAAWLVAHDTGLDLAAEWVERSLKIQPTFTAYMLKGKLLEKKGDAAGAKAQRDLAMTKGSEVEVNQFGYGLLMAGKAQESVEVFKRNAKDHPESWNAHDSLGEALEKAGEKSAAKASYQRALKLVKDEAQKARLEKVVAGL